MSIGNLSEQRQPTLQAARPVDDGSPIRQDQSDRIEVLQGQLRLGGRELGDIVKAVTRTVPLFQRATAMQADRIIAILEQRLKGAA
jgi:hypothetical protein